MSNREAVPVDQKTKQLLRSFDDRIGNLEKRQVNGSIAMDETKIGTLIVGATAANPVQLQGVANYSQAVENLGLARENAIITRDSSGNIISIDPVPFSQFFGGAATSVPAGTPTFMNLAACGVSSGPFPDPSMFDLPNSCMVTPYTGMYEILATVAWSPANDATMRRLGIAISSDGGATYNDFAFDMAAGISSLVDFVWQTIVIKTNAAIGNRWKITLAHRSATTPLSVTLHRFQQQWLRPASSVP